ncbi:arginine/serine-rich coiled coil protein [Striga asiatica]|uniref:Arginine/serine-rich coiled coil protein n=1 Tax=Striga asiatica TaxID=4170 RepID=A0A5A7QY38_STRAF|nr:arginine/serine-rich coiled coil protein [Striga asiatica]
MEDEKLAAYYDDLTRRGGGAARFKQGLGFSSGDPPASDSVPSRGSALPSAASFLSGFVRASSPSKTSEFEKQAQLQSIQNKLSKKPREKARSRSPSRNSSRRSRSSSRDRVRDKHSRRRSRSRSRDRHSRRRSRSRSRDRRSRRRSRSHEDEGRRKRRSRSRSREKNRERSKREVRGSGGIDYAKSIEGYNNMTPAERVKAKMKLQLSKTAEKDETIGKGSGWERFDFDKDAPLDDEEVEAAEDDAVLVKNMGQSFRFSAVEARREEQLKAAHDEAMFGGSSHPLPAQTYDQEEGLEKENTESTPVKSLLSEQVLTMQRGSWRDRARKS